MSFFTFFATIGTTYAELFPLIEEERPEVMKKLFKYRENMEEDIKNSVKIGFPNR
jgi:hypothetical protein